MLRGDVTVARPSSTRFIRPDYKQADLKKSSHAKACSAGAVASSIKWLLEQYKLKNGPDHQPNTGDDYNPSLDDLVEDFITRMHITASHGATLDEILKAKEGFINDHGLPLTVEHAEMPTGEQAVKDLYEQMKKGQDVELQLISASKADGPEGHTVCVVGMNMGKDRNGKDVYDVVVRDDDNQTKPRGEDEPDNGRRRASEVKTGAGVVPNLPGLGSDKKHIYSWTAESPTKDAVAYASSVVAEENHYVIATALGSGGNATESEAAAIAAGGAQIVNLTEKLIVHLEEDGYVEGLPQRTAGEEARHNAIYLRRADFDVYEYLDDPAAQNAALIEADTYASNVIAQLTLLTALLPPDADLDDVPDADDNCELANPDQADCNSNGLGDVCELGSETDCDGSGFLDECELAAGSADDCNANGIVDSCDLPGDFDGDGDSDMTDYAELANCLTGPCTDGYCDPPLYPVACCSLADPDDDGDVDLLDFARFQQVFAQEPVLTVDWCRLQWPTAIQAPIGVPVTVYGRLYIAGLTDQTVFNDSHPDVLGEVGYGTHMSDPTIGWTWFAATPNPGWDGGAAGEPNNDEYWADLLTPAMPGLYSYAYRFSADAGATWTYADLNTGLPGEDGSENGYQPENAGTLEVLP